MTCSGYNVVRSLTFKAEEGKLVALKLTVFSCGVVGGVAISSIVLATHLQFLW